MNYRILLAAFPSLLFASALAVADEGKITILSPAEGAVFGPNDKVAVRYEADLGPKGNHLHLYVDERRVDVLRQTKGTAEVMLMMVGPHQICLEIETRWHFSTGVKQCVNVTAK